MTECKQQHTDSRDRPRAIGSQVYIGHKITHESHDLINLRGLIYCNQCGCAGSHRVYNLGQPCKPVDWSIQSHGRESLKKLRQGLLPRHIKEWPDEAHSIFPSFSGSTHKKHKN